MGQYSKAIKWVITVCPVFTGDLDLDIVHRVCLALCRTEVFALQSDTVGTILVGYRWKTGLHSKTQSAGPNEVFLDVYTSRKPPLLWKSRLTYDIVFVKPG